MIEETTPTVRMRARGADVVLVAVRELRLLLGLLLVLFLTSETWRWIGRLSEPRLAAILAVAVAGAVLLASVGLQRTLPIGLGPDLTRTAIMRVVGEVVSFGAVLVTGFLVLGLVTIDRDLVAEWTGAPVTVIWSTGVGEPTLVLTRPLLRVALFLGAFGALAFAIEVVVDPATRQTLLRDVLWTSASRTHLGDDGQTDPPDAPVTKSRVTRTPARPPRRTGRRAIRLPGSPRRHRSNCSSSGSIAIATSTSGRHPVGGASTG